MMFRIALLVTVILMLAATPARADWWVKGFGGVAFARDSNIIDLEQTNAQRKPLFGAAAGRDLRAVQLEAEVALAPAFFRNPPGVLERGSLTTLTANVMWSVPALPEQVTAYLIGGGGLARIAIADKLDAFSRTSNKFVANAGGGLAVRMTPRLAACVEFRYFRTSESQPTAISFGSEYLGFARLAAGGRVRF